MMTHPNPLWQTDLKYGDGVGEDRFFSRQAVIDVCERMTIGYHRWLACKATDAARTIAQVVWMRQAQ